MQKQKQGSSKGKRYGVVSLIRTNVHSKGLMIHALIPPILCPLVLVTQTPADTFLAPNHPKKAARTQPQHT